MANGVYTDDLSLLDIEVEPEGKYFRYHCANFELDTARTCLATPKLADYPVLEFHMLNAGSEKNRGKHWCQVSSTPSEKARALCRTVGKADADITSGDYFLVGNQ